MGQSFGAYDQAPQSPRWRENDEVLYRGMSARITKVNMDDYVIKTGNGKSKSVLIGSPDLTRRDSDPNRAERQSGRDYLYPSLAARGRSIAGRGGFDEQDYQFGGRGDDLDDGPMRRAGGVDYGPRQRFKAGDLVSYQGDAGRVLRADKDSERYEFVRRDDMERDPIYVDFDDAQLKPRPVLRDYDLPNDDLSDDEFLDEGGDAEVDGPRRRRRGSRERGSERRVAKIRPVGAGVLPPSDRLVNRMRRRRRAGGDGARGPPPVVPDSVLQRRTQFPRWFSSVVMWHWAAAAFWQSALSTLFVCLSLFMATSPRAWLLRLLSPRSWPLIALFVASQALVLASRIATVKLQTTAKSPYQEILAYFGQRTWVIAAAVLASAPLGAWAYFQLAEPVLGDLTSLVATEWPMAEGTGSSDHRALAQGQAFVWSGVMVIALLYAADVALRRRDEILQFPSLQRSRAAQIKGVLPRCLAWAATRSFAFCAAWRGVVTLLGRSALQVGGWVLLRPFLGLTSMHELFADPAVDGAAAGAEGIFWKDGGLMDMSVGGVAVRWRSIYALFCVCFVLLFTWQLAGEVVWAVLTARFRFDSLDMLVAISSEPQDGDARIPSRELHPKYALHQGFLYLESIAQAKAAERQKVFRRGHWQVVSRAIRDVLDQMALDLHSVVAAHMRPRRRIPVSFRATRARAKAQLGALGDAIETARTCLDFRWLTETSPDKLASALSSNIQLCAWAAQALSFLTVAALRGEDAYGEVQRSFQELLNSLLALSIAVDEYIKGPASGVSPAARAPVGAGPARPAREGAFGRGRPNARLFVGSRARLDALQGRQLARSQWIFLASSVDNAIFRIVQGCYEQLRACQFPPAHAARLERYTQF